jgi:Rrf2 family protein
MIINNTIVYALLGLIYLSKNQQRSIKISEIAEKETISVSFLQKVFQTLSRAKIVKATFGPHGGFQLARPADKITLYQVVKAVKPEDDNFAKGLAREVSKHRDGKLLINFLFHVRNDFLYYLKSVTLSDLIFHK